MANLLDKFKTNLIGSDNKISDFTSKIGSSGDFGKVYGIETILLSWNNILLTPKGSYDHDPRYGSDLYKYVFSPCDDITKDQIKDCIKDSLIEYDSRATITSIEIKYLSNKKGFSVSINVKYDGEFGNLKSILDQNSYLQYMQ